MGKRPSGHGQFVRGIFVFPLTPLEAKDFFSKYIMAATTSIIGKFRYYYVLYMEEIEPGKAYVYKPDLVATTAGTDTGSVGTLGNVLLPE